MELILISRFTEKHNFSNIVNFPKISHFRKLSKPTQVLTGEPTFFKTYAKQDSVVLRMTKADFYSLMADYPKVVLNLAHTVVSRLSPFVR